MPHHPHPPTPLPGQHLGQVAYDAYWRVLAPIKVAWTALAQDERRAWQAAARAAIRDYLHREDASQPQEVQAIAQARAERDAEERVHDRAVAHHRREEEQGDV